MISQAETQLSPATNTTTNHPSRSNSANLHHTKSSKSFNVKKRKKIDEIILEDEFAIKAFWSLEEIEEYTLQEESSKNNTANIDTFDNDNNNSSNNLNINTNNSGNSHSNYETNCTADKKANSKSKSKTSSTSTSASLNSDTTPNLSTTPIVNTNNSNTDSQCLKKKIKKSAGHSQEKIDLKDKRNKPSSEKTTLKRALEAKELAEKQLSIVQEKLKKEQSKNRNRNNKSPGTNAITQEYYSIPQPQPQSQPQVHPHISKEELHFSSNVLLGRDLLKEPTYIPKAAQYPPSNINPHLHRPNSAIQNSMHLHDPSQPFIPRQSQPQTIPKHLSHTIQNQAQSQHPTPPPPLPPQPPTQIHQHHIHEQTTLQPPLPHQVHPKHPRAPLHTASQPITHPPLQHPNPHQPPQIHPYQNPPQSSIMPQMGLESFPAPYRCPPSICITNTISRQTRIIPPAPIVTALEPPPVPPFQSNSRFGQHSSSALHPTNPYYHVPSNPAMFYPSLCAERSFLEFRGSCAGLGNSMYPNLMNQFQPFAPSTTAAYSLDWLRTSFDPSLDPYQRAARRYDSFYQPTAAIPDRAAFPGYANSNPPPFSTGTFVSS